MRTGLIRMAAVLDRAEFVGRADDALRLQEARGQLAIETRRPHDDGERPAVQANVEGFFGGREIHRAPDSAWIDARNAHAACWRQPFRRRRMVLVRHDYAASARADAASGRSAPRGTRRRAAARNAGGA